METHVVLADLRKSNGLTQDEMAERLFVTRQAVSRWETGVTTPNPTTLKLISSQFKISIDSLLVQESVCQSCSMPLTDIEQIGTESDGGISTDYCSHCYQDGSFTSSRSMQEMIETNLRFLDHWNASQGTSYTEDEARKILTIHLATLKRWQDSTTV